MTDRVTTCPKCGTTDSWSRYGDHSFDEYPYTSPIYEGTGVWCAECKDYVVFLAPWEVEEVLFNLWASGDLDKYRPDED